LLSADRKRSLDKHSHGRAARHTFSFQIRHFSYGEEECERLAPEQNDNSSGRQIVTPQDRALMILENGQDGREGEPTLSVLLGMRKI
jgi:hypothetical protein